MSTSGVKLGCLIAAGATDSACVDATIAATDVGLLIACARTGDVTAARELLGLASAYLVSDIHGPMTPELRRYLAHALAEVSLGKSAEIGLNLKTPGRPKRYHRTKLRISHMIFKEIAKNKTLDEASIEIADYIHMGLKKYSVFYGFNTIPDPKTLQGIYNEMLPELRELYQKIKSRK